LIRHVRFVSQGWLPHSAATSPASAYLPHARQVFASPGWRPHLTRHSTHSKFERGKKPVTLNQMIRLVASLGGFLGRKSDGEPGAKTIWIGMQRTMDAAFMIQALREDS